MGVPMKGEVPQLSSVRECSQHKGMVPRSDEGEYVVSQDKLRRRYVCAACKANNLRKLAALFAIDELEIA